MPKTGFLTESDGKFSSGRLVKVGSFVAAIGLIVLDAVAKFIAFQNGQQAPQIADFQLVILLLGNALGFEIANYKTKKIHNGNDSV